ncbi:MAG: hypothetical protein U0R44_01175 [Candidatus Micrarchaeia archaeon]
MRNLVTILVVAVLLAGCASKAPSGGSPSGVDADLNSCLAHCPDPNVNLEIGCEQVCYSNAAEATMDVSYCDKMLPRLRENVTDLYDGCVWDVAKGKNDAPLCDKMKVSSNRDYCILDVAKNTKNPAACDSIKDPSTKNACISNAS